MSGGVTAAPHCCRDPVYLQSGRSFQNMKHLITTPDIRRTITLILTIFGPGYGNRGWNLAGYGHWWGNGIVWRRKLSVKCHQNWWRSCIASWSLAAVLVSLTAICIMTREWHDSGQCSLTECSLSSSGAMIPRVR